MDNSVKKIYIENESNLNPLTIHVLCLNFDDNNFKVISIYKYYSKFQREI